MEGVEKISKSIEQKILQEIRDGIMVFTPKQCDDYRLLLVSWYDKYSEEQAEVDIQCAEMYLELKNGDITIKEAEMRVDTSEIGKRRIRLKYKLRAMEKMIGALKDRLRRLNNESYNQY